MIRCLKPITPFGPDCMAEYLRLAIAKHHESPLTSHLRAGERGSAAPGRCCLFDQTVDGHVVDLDRRFRATDELEIDPHMLPVIRPGQRSLEIACRSAV